MVVWRKDESRLVAKARIAPMGLRHCVYAYLWADKDAMYAATGEQGCDACAVHVPYISGHAYTWWQALLRIATMGVVDLGEQVRKHPVKSGELHFIAGEWDEEIVANECLHLTVGITWAYQLSPSHIFSGSGEVSPGVASRCVAAGLPESAVSDNELFCYLHGDMVRQVYRWLWEVNPNSAKWARVAA